MVFQNYALYPHMTVRENMAFSLKLREGAARTRSSERVAAGRRDPRPAALLDRYPAPALGRPAPARRHGPGDRARPAGVPVRRAACPTSTPSCACRCAPRSRSCTSGSKTTSVYVTHDQIEAMTMADRIVVMHDGVVEQIGDAARALRPPGQPVRRRLHRLAGDELHRRHARGATAASARSRSRRHAAAAARRPPAAGTASRSCTASGRSIST